MAAGLLAAILGTPAFATGNDASAAPPISCGNGIPGGVKCIASKKELKEARNAFREGVKLQDHRQLEQAFTKFDDCVSACTTGSPVSDGARSGESTTRV